MPQNIALKQLLDLQKQAYEKYSFHKTEADRYYLQRMNLHKQILEIVDKAERPLTKQK